MDPVTEAQPGPAAHGGGSWGRRLRVLVPPSSAGRRLIAMSFVNATGSGLWMTGAALYFTKVVGVSAAEVGLGLSVAGVVGLFTTMPVGLLIDRFGPRKVYAALTLWRAGGFLAYAFARGFVAFIVVACLLGAVDRATGATTQSLVGAAVGARERVRTMGYLMATRNAGFTVGGALASAVIALGSHAYVWLVLGNAMSFLLAVPLVLTIREREPLSAQPIRSLFRSLPRDPRFLQIAAVNGMLVAHFTLLSVTIPLWIVTRTDAPRTMLGVLFMINTLGASLFQVAVSGRTGSLPVAAGRYRQAGLALFLCCAAVAVTGHLAAAWASALLVLAILLLTVAELTQSAAGWQVSFELADDERRGSYLAAFSLGESLQSILGPVVLTWVVVTAGSGGWLAVGAFLLVSGLTARALTGSARRQPAAAG